MDPFWMLGMTHARKNVDNNDVTMMCLFTLGYMVLKCYHCLKNTASPFPEV